MRHIVVIGALLLLPALAFAQSKQVCITIPEDAAVYFDDTVIEYEAVSGQTITDEEYVYAVTRRDMRILLGRKHNKEKEQAKQNSVSTLLDDIDSAMP